MLYAILAYHVEAETRSWTAEEDASAFARVQAVRERLKDQLGPAARLGDTRNARTLRGPGRGTVIDGPFAETKEQLLGIHMIDCADMDAAIAVARDLRSVNPTVVYEIRAIKLYVPGSPFPETARPRGI